MKKLKTIDMEIALAYYFDYRSKLIVPNIFWGANLHECDLLVLSNSGYATEVEIKISKTDLLQDRKKSHKHISNKIKKLYFAIPEYLLEYSSYVPVKAGIIIVYTDKRKNPKEIRKAQINIPSYKFTDKERYNIARLGTMRIWKLKRKLRKI